MNQEILFLVILAATSMIAIILQVLTIIYTPKTTVENREDTIKLIRDKWNAVTCNLTCCEILNGICMTEKGILLKEVDYVKEKEIVWMTREFYKKNKFLLLSAGFKKEGKKDDRRKINNDNS